MSKMGYMDFGFRVSFEPRRDRHWVKFVDPELQSDLRTVFANRTLDTVIDMTARSVPERRELARWLEFAAGNFPPKTESTRRLALFRARWRLASSFDGLSAPGYSDRVLDGYSAAFRVMLAYTAHEQLALCAGRKHNEYSMEDAVLAADVRRWLSPLLDIVVRDARQGVREQVVGLREGRHDDIRPVAYGIRNVVAHGPFAGSRLRTKTSLGILDRLASKVLLDDERWFGEWLDR